MGWGDTNHDVDTLVSCVILAGVRGSRQLHFGLVYSFWYEASLMKTFSFV